MDCPGTHKLRNWLLTYLSISFALVGFFSIKFGAILSIYFYYIIGGIGGGVLLLIPIHSYYVKKQISVRNGIIDEVADEMVRILRINRGSGMKLSDLKKELHSSCRPYFDVALKKLRAKELIE